jgi:hypothetical protein
MAVSRSFGLRASSRLSRWKRAIAAFSLALLMAIAAMTGPEWARFVSSPSLAFAATEQPSPVSLENAESVKALPFWVWVVLPRLFPEKLPGAGGYASLGLKWERGNELPTGFVKETNGVPKVVLNDLVEGNFDVQRYAQFLFDCAQDPRFNPDFILPEITYNINLSLFEKLQYRFSVIPETKKRLLSDANLFVTLQ